MKSIKCKKCNCDIYAEYNPMDSLNDNLLGFTFKKKKNVKKYFGELNINPSETCNTGIYLTCQNNHIEKYFCKIEIE